VWASNVEYVDAPGTDLEVDLSAGWSGDVVPRLALDVSFTRYTYPGTAEEFDLDYNEVVATLTWDNAGWLLVGYSDDVFASGTSGIYYQVGLRFALGRGFRLELLGGHYSLDEYAAQAYAHAQVSGIYAWKRLEFRLSGHFTDGKAAEVFGKQLTDERAEAAVSFSF
jgi:uncharacterized protein (TIGR02001 family)